MEQKSINLNGSSFSGNLVQGNSHGDISVHIKEDTSMTNNGDTYNVGQAGAVGKYASSDRNTFTQSEQRQTLSEAAAEIQNLLKQLEKTQSHPSEIEKINYVNDETTPSLKRRVSSALKSGSITAVEVCFEQPYIKVGAAIMKGWLDPQ